MEILNDFQTSVRRAFDEIDPMWKSYEGLVICGTHLPIFVERQIRKIRKVRESQIPFLGICFGHQLAAIEYARNVLGIKDATSQEFCYEDEFFSSECVVKKLPKLKVGLHDGESYWNNYEVVPGLLELWKKPSNFITVQYHPEYQSSKDKPHPILKQFLELCQKQQSV